MEAAVLEVVLDSGAADPADAAVDDEQLAVVDVPEPGQVPTSGAHAAERPDGCARFRRPDDADLDSGSGEPLVELPRAALRVGALPVDDEPDGYALRRLRDQGIGEGVPDDTGPEPELVDVNRGRRGGDVLEHAGVEARSLHEHFRRRRRALGELECQRSPVHGSREEALGVLTDSARPEQ